MFERIAAACAKLSQTGLETAILAHYFAGELFRFPRFSGAMNPAKGSISMSMNMTTPSATAAASADADRSRRQRHQDIAGAINALLADTFALYLKTKNFHWHVSGPHFRDYHLLLDEQADQIFATTDVIAERVRKIGGTPCARSATSRASSASPTTMPTMSSPTTCWRNCATTISA